LPRPYRYQSSSTHWLSLLSNNIKRVRPEQAAAAAAAELLFVLHTSTLDFFSASALLRRVALFFSVECHLFIALPSKPASSNSVEYCAVGSSSSSSSYSSSSEKKLLILPWRELSSDPSSSLRGLAVALMVRGLDTRLDRGLATTRGLLGALGLSMLDDRLFRGLNALGVVDRGVVGEIGN
jgi:hypothetical protein